MPSEGRLWPSDDNDDDDDDQGMGCHCSELRLQLQVIKSHFFSPIVLFARIGFDCAKERGKIVTKVRFL